MPIPVKVWAFFCTTKLRKVRSSTNEKLTQILSFVFVIAVFLFGAGQISSPLYEKSPTPLTIETTEGASVQFQTVVVTEPADLQRGLMHIKHLAVNQSMLFIYQESTTATFWMKNTYVSLDLLFIATDGLVVDIHHHATPLSTDQISSSHEVVAVLEINAGLCQKLGIKAGSVVRHSILGTSKT